MLSQKQTLYFKEKGMEKINVSFTQADVKAKIFPLLTAAK